MEQNPVIQLNLIKNYSIVFIIFNQIGIAKNMYDCLELIEIHLIIIK